MRTSTYYGGHIELDSDASFHRPPLPRCSSVVDNRLRDDARYASTPRARSCCLSCRSRRSRRSGVVPTDCDDVQVSSRLRRGKFTVTDADWPCGVAYATCTNPIGVVSCDFCALPGVAFRGLPESDPQATNDRGGERAQPNTERPSARTTSETTPLDGSLRENLRPAEVSQEISMSSFLAMRSRLRAGHSVLCPGLGSPTRAPSL